jgi:hypothetical protein
MLEIVAVTSCHCQADREKDEILFSHSIISYVPRQDVEKGMWIGLIKQSVIGVGFKIGHTDSMYHEGLR